MKRSANVPFDVASDEDAREMRANLTEFFTILLEWDAAQSPSASSVDEEPVPTNRGRSHKP